MLVVHPSSTCDVCLDPYSWATPENTPHAIACGHIFCRSCLHLILEQRCPLCRKAFQEDRIKKLHVDQCNAPNDEHQNRDREYLSQVSLCFPEDTSDEQVNGVVGEVHQWLATRSDDSCMTLKALRAAVEGLHKYKLLIVENLRDKNMIRKHVRAVHELREDNRALRAVENAAVLKCTELTEQLEKMEQDCAALRSERARYHAELTRLKHLSNPLPPPPRQIHLERAASLTAPSSQSTWTTPAAVPSYLIYTQRPDGSYMQGPIAPEPETAPVLREDETQIRSPHRPQIVPGAQLTEKFIPPVPSEIEQGFTRRPIQTTSSSRGSFGAVAGLTTGYHSSGSRADMVPGPSGHGASGSTINRAVDIRATSATPWPQVTQPCAPSTSTQRANERDASTDGNLSSRVSLHFDYRPQPLHVSTPVRRNALNPETRTVQAAAAETSRSGVSVLAPVPDGDVVVLPGALEDVTNVYPTPSTTRPRRAADRSIQLTEGGATDSSSGSRDLLAPVLLQALAIDNAFPLARRSTRDHLLGQASNGTSGSRASSMQVERGTVLQDTLAAPSQPSPASSWGTVNSRVSGSTSRSSLALGLTGLPTELELPPAAAEEEQTAYVPLPNPSRHTSTLLEPNMTPRGRRVSFRGDFFDAVPQSSGQRSEPPALGLNLGSDNSGQVIHGDRDLAHLDQSLMQLAVGHRENERSRTASPLRYSAGTEPSAPSRASGQQVWVGPRTGLPIYMTPTPGIVEDASGSSVAPGTSRAVFSSWHNNNSADVFSGPASGSTRHTGMTYPYSDSSTRLARQRSSVSRSSIASSRESSVSAYSFHGASGPRSSGSSHSHTHNSANSSTRHQTGTREVYGVPVSDDDRLPALSQGSLLLSFGTPSTSSAVIGTEEASEIRAPRPISSRSSSLFGSLASL